MEGVLKNIIGVAAWKTKEAEDTFSQNIINELSDISKRMKELTEKYNLISDDDLIEAFIYEELALKSRYSYLLRLAKVNHIQFKGNFLQ